MNFLISGADLKSINLVFIFHFRNLIRTLEQKNSDLAFLSIFWDRIYRLTNNKRFLKKRDMEKGLEKEITKIAKYQTKES